jgi:hypothetical protein
VRGTASLDTACRYRRAVGRWDSQNPLMAYSIRNLYQINKVIYKNGYLKISIYIKVYVLLSLQNS